MPYGLFGLVGALSALGAAGTDAPVCWTADGRWFAYTVAARADRVLPAPGWIFGGPFETPRAAEPAGRLTYRLYASEPATATTVLLEESDAPLTSPAWSPDGRALAFGRQVAGPAGTSRFEVVVQDGVNRKRVLLTRPVFGAVDDGHLPRRTLAWSPDGRYLAIPASATSPDLLVVRADTGMVLKSIAGAAAPSWSPDGTRLAVVQGDSRATLAWLDTTFGQPRVLAELGAPLAVPSWSRDGKTILAVATRVNTSRTRMPTQSVEVVGVAVDDGRVETVQALLADPLGRERGVRGVALSADRDTEDVFSVVELDEPSVVVWFRPRTAQTVLRFYPLGEASIRVAAIAVSPGAKALAVRFGGGDGDSTVGVWDTASRTIALNDPDDATRLDWVCLLISSARTLLDHALPRPTVEGRPVGRPTVLPVPGEIPTGQETLLRLRRLGRYGRPLCDRPSESLADPALDAFLAEARLFFDALQEDYPAALADLDALEGKTDDPDRLVRLLALRAQFLMGQGDRERAGDLITYLRALDAHVPSRLEETAAGSVLTPTPGDTTGWARYLARRADDRPKAQPPQSGLRGLPIEAFAPDPPGFGRGFLPNPPPPPQAVPPAPPEEPEVRIRFGRFGRRMRPGPP